MLWLILPGIFVLGCEIILGANCGIDARIFFGLLAAALGCMLTLCLPQRWTPWKHKETRKYPIVGNVVVSSVGYTTGGKYTSETTARATYTIVVREDGQLKGRTFWADQAQMFDSANKEAVLVQSTDIRNTTSWWSPSVSEERITYMIFVPEGMVEVQRYANTSDESPQ